MTQVNCNSQSKAHANSEPLMRCPMLSYLFFTILILEGKMRTISCLQTTISSTSPTQTTDQRSPLPKPQMGLRGLKKQMCSSSHSARTCAGVCNTIVHSRKESISLKITHYIPKTFTVVQLLISYITHTLPKPLVFTRV